jgi:hypothetical protein
MPVEFRQIKKSVFGRIRVSEETCFRRSEGLNPAFEESHSRRFKANLELQLQPTNPKIR